MSRQRDELLAHDADGIHEFDNDLPRWWLYGFYVTVVFAVIYLVNFHVLSTPIFGQSIAAEYAAEAREAEARAVARSRAGAATGSVVVARTDPESIAKGRAIFESPTSLCSSCHRPDLGGLVGPNLTDERWLHGCSVKEVMTSIRTGYPAKGMLPFGSTSPLTDQQLQFVASYVLSRHGSQPLNPKPSDPDRDKTCS
jgi:cytochrome c oxidase cbb3-type subunit 3